MIVGSKNINDNLISQLIEEIKSKKELRGIDDSLVKSEMLRIITQNKKMLDFLSAAGASENEKIKKSGSYKEIIKKSRAILRKSVGVFIKNTRVKDFDNLLLSHESTKERIAIYPEIYKRIFHITGSPQTILDLGCGLNPLSYKFMKINPFYYAIDVSSIVIEIVSLFFEKEKINGKAEIINLREIKDRKLKLPKADVCFMFKLLDSLELEKGHRLAEKLVREVDCSWIAASFSKRTLSGKRMNHPYRGWIEQMCRRLNYFYEIIDFDHEVFYIIKKA